MTVRKRWRNPAVLCAVCVLAFLGTAHVANAQTSPSAMLDQFRAVRMTWLTVAAGYANRLFGLLALIEFAWTAAILVLERTDLQGWTAALIRKMMFIGAFFAPKLRRGLDSADHQQLSTDWAERLRPRIAGAYGHPRPGPQHHWKPAQRGRQFGLARQHWHGPVAGVCGAARVSGL